MIEGSRLSYHNMAEGCGVVFDGVMDMSSSVTKAEQIDRLGDEVIYCRYLIVRALALEKIADQRCWAGILFIVCLRPVLALNYTLNIVANKAVAVQADEVF